MNYFNTLPLRLQLSSWENAASWVVASSVEALTS